jgi:hypothetical protein
MPIYVTEFADSKVFQGQVLPVSSCPPIAEQRLTISGVSAQTSAFNSRTRIVRVSTSEVCSIAFGASPTATTSTMRLAANATEYFAVNGGDRLAGITNT